MRQTLPKTATATPTLSRSRLIILGTFATIALIFVVLATRGTSTPGTTSAGCGTTTATSVQHVQGSFTEFAMPHPQSDLMSPTVDGEGNIWVGEMGANRLGRLDPTTGTITEWRPPQGHGGIMGMVVDGQGAIWYAEEAGNYISHFTPGTCDFANYALPLRGGEGAAPVGMALDASGQPWFTLFGNDQIGTIDRTTNKVRLFPLTSPDPKQLLSPYGITIGNDGSVWFTLLSAAAIGRLDPATGAVKTFALPTRDAQPHMIITGPDGRLWFTELNTGILGVVDPQSGQVREFPTPPQLGDTAELYDLAFDAQGKIWVTSSGANALLRFDPAAATWQAVSIPTPGSAPYGIILHSGTIWFTESAPDANQIGRYQPG